MSDADTFTMELVDHPAQLRRALANLARHPLLFTRWEREAIELAAELVADDAA